MSQANRNLYFHILPEQAAKYAGGSIQDDFYADVGGDDARTNTQLAEANMCIKMSDKPHTYMKPTTLLTNKPISFEEQGLCFYYEVKILGMSR